MKQSRHTLAVGTSIALPLDGATAYLDYIRRTLGHAPDTIGREGELVRFATNSKRGDKAGWCVWYGVAGVFGDWRTGETYKWHAERYKRLSIDERKRIDRKIRQVEARRRQEIEAEYRRVAEQAREDIKRFKPATEAHPYLKEKMIKPHGVLVDDKNVLIIPLYYRGEIVSYQRILPYRLPDGTNKRFLTGGRKTGCYYPIGDTGTGDLGICEGFATGASIHEATGSAVIVALDAGNLLPVARAMRDMYPDRGIKCWADDDYRRKDRNGNPENIGIIKATEAAQAVNGYLVVPDFGEDRPEGATDFNDLYRMTLNRTNTTQGGAL